MAKVDNYNGYPAIIVDGKPYPPMMATIRTNNRDSMVIDEEYYKNLGKSGIKIYFLICDTEWLKPNGFNMFCEEAEKLLNAVPEAYIMVRIGMHPTPEWCKENPDETLCYSDGIKKPMHLYTESYEAEYPAMYSLCSEKWRKDAGDALKSMVYKIKELPYGDRIIGYFFAAGGTSEWYYMTPTEYTSKTTVCDSGGWEQTGDFSFDNVYADLSPAFKKNFSKYLKNMYGSAENLKKSWKNEHADMENPEIPDCESRYYVNGVDYDIAHPPKMWANSSMPEPPSNGTNIGHFLDMENHRAVFDFYRAWHIGVAESVVYFGNVIKTIDEELLTGAFYGSAGSNKPFSMGQIGGVTNILDSGKVDFLASPGVYENRQPGGFVGQRQVPDSFSLRNTMFIVEEDARTHFENPYYAKYMELFSMEDSITILKREFARNICQNLQAWWFDQILGGGRYKHPDIYNLFEKQQQIAHEAYSKNRIKNSEIAFIYDEESYHVVAEETTHQMVELFRNYEIDIIGAPCDRYYHNDMANPNMPDYKLYVFMNTFYLTNKEREDIITKLKKNNATALFMYGSGFINPDADKIVSGDNVSDLTGFDIEVADGIFAGMMKFRKDSENPIARAMDKGEIYGDFKRKMWLNVSSYMNDIKKSKVHLYPGIYATDGESIAYFLDTRKSSINIKKTNGFTSIYCGSKFLSADVIKEIARFAGCHIYSETDDVLYANKDYVAIHASKSGAKKLKLPCVASAQEVYEEKYYSNCSDCIELDMLKGETKMFRLDK